MRISLPICIASSLAVVALSWWLSTRSRDFLTPPTESELAGIRLKAAQTNPTASGGADALSPSRGSAVEIAPIPVILPRHVNQAPALDDYGDEAKHGAVYLAELAELLQREHPERALTCWERVLDSCKANASLQQRAMGAIEKLKTSVPAWNEDPAKGIPILIEVGTGPSAAALLEPALIEVSAFITRASSGVLHVSHKVSTGSEDMIENGKSPVAMWMSGLGKESASTDVVSFFVPVGSTESQTKRVQTEVYRIVSHHLNQMDKFQPLPKPSGQHLSERLLNAQITRFAWQHFAESLHARR